MRQSLRNDWSGKFPCVIVCLPLQQTDEHKEDVGTILGVVEMLMCTERNREGDAVVKRRFGLSSVLVASS